MSCGALVLHSLALIAHATFLVPSVVAVPCEPLLESSTQPEVWISGPQDKRNGVRVGTMFQPLSVGVHAQFAANVELVAAAKTQECLAADAGTAHSRAVSSEHIVAMKDGTIGSGVPMLESDARSSSSPSAELALPPQLSLPSLKLDQGLEPDLAELVPLSQLKLLSPMLNRSAYISVPPKPALVLSSALQCPTHFECATSTVSEAPLASQVDGSSSVATLSAWLSTIGSEAPLKASPTVRLFEFAFRASCAAIRWTCKTLMAVLMALVSLVAVWITACLLFRCLAQARHDRARRASVVASVTTLQVLRAAIIVAAGVVCAAAAVSVSALFFSPSLPPSLPRLRSTVERVSE